MKRYEVGFIIKPTLSEEQIDTTINTLKNIYINANCKILDEENVGMRTLAYEIEKHKSGFYFFMIVEANSETNKEFERICRISEDVIRFMVLNVSNVEGNTLEMLRK